MKNILIGASNYNIVKLQSPKKLQGLTNNVELTFSVGDTFTEVQLVMSKTIKVDDTKCHI